jgi:putative glutamine amidotransferase
MQGVYDILHFMRPTIGITADHHEKRHKVAVAYSVSVISAGGTPIILPPISSQSEQYLSICDGFVFTGGDDPRMEHWGIKTHHNAKPVSKERQTSELALLSSLQEHPNVPVFGICFGMQLMGLMAGGSINQDLQEPVATNHRTGEHEILGELGTGFVHTNHHQAIVDPGRLSVVATANDGVIEAVQDHTKNWYVGVQWHPERTIDPKLGQSLFDSFVSATSMRAKVKV